MHYDHHASGHQLPLSSLHMTEPSESPSCSILLSYLQTGSLRFSGNIPFSCILDPPPLFSLYPPRLITSGPVTTLGLY